MKTFVTGTCPICLTKLFVSASLHLGGIAAMCPNACCPANEIVEVAEKEEDAIAQFKLAAIKERGE